MWNLRNKKNKLIKNRLKNNSGQFGDRQREGGFRRLGGWSEGLKKYKLVADGWSWGWGAQHRECSYVKLY